MLEAPGYIPSDGAAGKKRGAAARTATEKVAGPSTPHGGTLVNRELAAKLSATSSARGPGGWSVSIA